MVARTRLGGHGVLHDRIIARYGRIMVLPPEAVRIAHRATIFDNTYPLTAEACEGHRPLRVVVEVANEAGKLRLINRSTMIPNG